MVKLMIMAALVGAVLAIAIAGYAHSGNGFQTGPIVLLALALSGLGTVATGILTLIGKRGQHLAAVGAFSVALLVVLIILPLLWPYPLSPGPRSLDERPGPSQPK